MRIGGVRMALLAAVLFGASTPLAKGLLLDTSPRLLAGLLYLGSGAGLLLVRLVQRGRASREAALSRPDLPWLAGAIASGGVLAAGRCRSWPLLGGRQQPDPESFGRRSGADCRSKGSWQGR